MSQKNQGNRQSEREGAEHGKSMAPQHVSGSGGVEKVGGPTGTRFGVPNHREVCDVKSPKGDMDG